MPRKKIPCPECGQPMAAESQMCRKCKPTYERTPAHKEAMSRLLAGRQMRGVGWSYSKKTRQKMVDVWTDERRAEKSVEVLGRNPNARYHGLSAKSAARLVKRIGECERCQHDGSKSRLDVHHKNRDKHDQSPENLEILCHRCHMREHATAGETGWNQYHAKRRQR